MEYDLIDSSTSPEMNEPNVCVPLEAATTKIKCISRCVFSLREIYQKRFIGASIPFGSWPRDSSGYCFSSSPSLSPPLCPFHSFIWWNRRTFAGSNFFQRKPRLFRLLQNFILIVVCLAAELFTPQPYSGMMGSMLSVQCNRRDDNIGQKCRKLQSEMCVCLVSGRLQLDTIGMLFHDTIATWWNHVSSMFTQKKWTECSQREKRSAFHCPDSEAPMRHLFFSLVSKAIMGKTHATREPKN